MEGYAYSDNNPIVHADPSGQSFRHGDTAGTPESENPYNPNSESVYDTPQYNPPSTQHKSKSKHCGLVCSAKHKVTQGINWADDHKAAIAGVVTGIVVGVGCEAALGVTGVGAVACGALAGAAANMVQYTVETEVEHKGNFSLGGMLVTGVEGAIVGGVMGGLGSIGGKAVKAGFSSLMSGVGAKAAVAAGRSAAKRKPARSSAA
jgi:hypothetical protein